MSKEREKPRSLEVLKGVEFELGKRLPNSFNGNSHSVIRSNKKQNQQLVKSSCCKSSRNPLST